MFAVACDEKLSDHFDYTVHFTRHFQVIKISKHINILEPYTALINLPVSKFFLLIQINDSNE